jgi:tetratricopeptide (TPR) repeat protein
MNKWNALIVKEPNNPNLYIQRGMAHFKVGNILESIEDFDRAEILDPRLTPYLWQRGLSYYYAERFAEGAQQFAIDLTVNGRDLEETLWQYLCIARLEGIERAKFVLSGHTNDSRRVMHQIYDLYTGKCSLEEVLKVGQQEGIRGNFYAHLYIALYWEALTEIDKSRDYLILAVERYPLKDYMWYLACVHKQLREF